MILEYKDHIITNLTEWENLVFTGKKKVHWKKGRSAYSLADFILNKNGVKQIEKTLSSVIAEPFVFDKAHPEFEACFDNYGHGREHDLAIWVTTITGKKLFVGVEAKVDESFGDTIETAINKAKVKLNRGENTNALKRIEELLAFNFNSYKEKDFRLRDQLLYCTAGTLCIEADIHVLLILVFKTKDYNVKKGAENYKSLQDFLKRSDAKELDDNTFQIVLNNQRLIVVYKEYNPN